MPSVLPDACTHSYMHRVLSSVQWWSSSGYICMYCTCVVGVCVYNVGSRGSCLAINDLNPLCLGSQGLASSVHTFTAFKLMAET